MPKEAKKEDIQRKRMTQYFSVKGANKYEESGTASKIVEIKLIEIVYKNELCNLIYMRDVTKMV